MTDERKPAVRLKLTITEIGEKKDVGQKKLPKLFFKAKTPDGKELSYSIFAKTSLFPSIVKDTTIEADVETSEREWEGQTYIDRQVTEIYVDGNPIGGKQQKQWGKSIEVVTLEIDSKFRDTALMQACEMAKSEGKTIPVNHVLEIADKFYHWLKGEALKTENPTTDTAKGVKKPPDASNKAKTPPYEDSPAGRSALVSDYVRKGMPLADIYETLGIKTPAEIIDVDEAMKVLEAHTAKKV